MSDIIDRIDELVDQQMAGGEPRQGWDYGDPTYPKCPHCGRHWHGLKVTKRISDMYNQGRYDPAYSAAEDNSPVLCEGSDFIGPQRGPAMASFTERLGHGPLYILPGRRELNFSIVLDATAFRASIERAQRQMEELIFGAGFVEAMENFGNAMREGLRGFRQVGLLLDEAAIPEQPCPPGVEVEFGPQNWGHDFHRTPGRPQAYIITQHTRAVARLWDDFTAPDFPVPERRPYDFDAIRINGFGGTGPELPPLGRSS